MENGPRMSANKHKYLCSFAFLRGSLSHFLTFPISLLLVCAFIVHAQTTIGGDTRSGSAPTDRRAVEDLVQTGQRLLAQKRYGEAMREFEKAIAVDKTYVSAYQWLGQAYVSQGMLAEALSVFQRAAAVSPNNGSAHFNLGVLLGRKGRYEEAIREYARAVELGVKHPGVHHNLGIIYSKQGEHAKAISEYQKAIESANSSRPDTLYPRSAQLRYDLALEYSKMRDISSASKLAESAGECIGKLQSSQSLADTIELRYDLGALLSRLGKHEDALTEYEKAAALIESDAKLGDSLPTAPRERPGASSWGKRKTPQSQSAAGASRLRIWGTIAELCFALRKFDKAEKAFRKAIEYAADRPNKANYHVALSNVYASRYDFNAAEQELRNALRLDPSNTEAHFGMGCLLWRRNDLEHAGRSLRTSLAGNPNKADAHFLLGSVLQEQGKGAKAIGEFRKAIGINPKQSLYHYRLANELIKQGQREEGTKHLKKYEILLQREGQEKRKQIESIEAHPDRFASDRSRPELKFITTPLRTRRDEYAEPVALTTPLSPVAPTDSLPEQESARPSPVEQARQTKADSMYPRFADVTLDSGLDFEHYHGAKGPVTILETTGAGVAFCDYDKDGYLDIYAVNGCDPATAEQMELVNSESLLVSGERWPITNHQSPIPQHRNALYRNLGNGTFLNVTSAASIGDLGYGMGCVFGDYDNDGDDDLYVSNYGKNALYRNNGNGTFADVTDAAGVGDTRFGASCAFADYDSDGDLDLYVTNYVAFGPETVKYCIDQGIMTGCGPMHYEAQSDCLYLNNGDGTFTDVSKEAGIAKHKGKGLGVMFADYDNDGDLDVYVANDTTPNFLFRNDGNGKFTEVGLLAGVAFDQDGRVDSGMGVDFGDYNGDGYFDLFVTNFQSMPNTLYLNDRNGLFTPATFRARLAEPSLKYLAFGTEFFDYDNDGDLDLFIANGHVYDNVELFDETATYRQKNQLFRNERDGAFAEVTEVSGSGMLIEKASRGAAFGDYDNDGDIDIVVSNSNDILTLLRNDGGNVKNFLTIELIGVRSNRNGIGSRINISCRRPVPVEPLPRDSERAKTRAASAVTQIAEVKSGASFLSHSDFRVTFGLGNHTSAESLEIKWPSGIVDRIENVPADSFLRVVEGRENAKVRK